MSEPPDDRRTKDLLRAGELEPPDTLGLALSDRLRVRSYRRPVGATPRLFASLGMEDPLHLPGEPQTDTRKPLYVAGRFVRLEEEERSQLPELPRVPRAESRSRRSSGSSRPVHTPSAASTPPDPLAAKKAARSQTPTEGPTPAPTRPPLPRPKRVSKAGRLRLSPKRVVKQAGAQRPSEPPARPSPPTPPPKRVPPPPSRPPQAGREAADRPAPSERAPEQPAPATTPSPPKPPSRPPKPAQPGPPALGGNAASLDDLFGGSAQEGRVRLGRRKKKKAVSGEDEHK